MSDDDTEKLAEKQVEAFEKRLQRETNLSFSDLRLLADQLHRHRRIANGISVGIIVSLVISLVSGVLTLAWHGLKVILKLG